MGRADVSPRDLLRKVIPFRFLSPADQESLLPHLSVEHFPAGTEIIRKGDPGGVVYLLASGRAEVCDLVDGHLIRRNLIEPEHYFGEWESLFDVPRVFTIRAHVDSTCVVIEGDRFLEVVERSPAMAQSLGVILRDQQGVFAAFDRFKVELMRGLNNGYLTIAKLLPLYTALRPAIHPLAGSPRIDTAALSYVIRRLPENVTTTFAYLLTDAVPAGLQDTDALFEQVTTEARRRDVWEMLPGSSLVLLRNGISDLVDLVSCLCLYAVEARKIRRRFTDSRVVRALATVTSRRADAALERLPFSDEERAGLHAIWGSNTPRRLLDIVKHRETFAVTIRRHSEHYNSRRAELWTKQLAAACRSLIDRDPSDFPTDYPVHIISSNTHSVGNCLSSWYTAQAERMRSWAETSGHPLLATVWNDPYDFLYAIARDYFVAQPDAAADATDSEVEQGIYRLRETASTGIQVQLIDMDRVCRSSIDPGVSGGRNAPGLIVNIDYAFGEQAEHILRSLLLLFGRNVRSVNFLGKAGALLGSRADVLLPTMFVQQSGDQLYEIPPESRRSLDETSSALRRRLVGGEVRTGAMLTVDGTLLQNRDMLRFYRYIWSCIGMEMEGAYYYRQFREAKTTGLIDPDVPAGFYYYVSDIPLEHKANLTARLLPHEGVPPLYAITRQVLADVFAVSQ